MDLNHSLLLHSFLVTANRFLDDVVRPLIVDGLVVAVLARKVGSYSPRQGISDDPTTMFTDGHVVVVTIAHLKPVLTGPASTTCHGFPDTPAKGAANSAADADAFDSLVRHRALGSSAKARSKMSEHTRTEGLLFELLLLFLLGKLGQETLSKACLCRLAELASSQLGDAAYTSAVDSAPNGSPDTTLSLMLTRVGGPVDRAQRRSNSDGLATRRELAVPVVEPLQGRIETTTASLQVASSSHHSLLQNLNCRFTGIDPASLTLC